MIYDYLVIGAGISGAAAAYELALHGKVVIVEAEPHAGFHSTGRSAALYTPNYGPDLIRRISQLGLPFLSHPPQGFTDHPLLSDRGMMTVLSTETNASKLGLLDGAAEHFVSLSQEQTLNMAPFLRADRVSGAVYEQGVKDIDVDAMHQGFLRGFKKRGGTVQTNSRTESILRKSSYWEVSSANSKHHARVIVNAAGAWADEIGAMANANVIEIQPKRRTAIVIDTPEVLSSAVIPAINFYGVENYLKPATGQLMVSPGDETPVAPQDIQPDDMDIAKLVDWFERETTIEVKRIEHSWAGLRNFVADGLPVVGFDARVEDFFWLAAQGGYGIMMSEPLGRASASLIMKNGLPEDFIDAGINEHELSVKRLRAEVKLV